MRRDKETCTTPPYIGLPTLYIKLCAHSQSLYAAYTPVRLLLGAPGE